MKVYWYIKAQKKLGEATPVGTIVAVPRDDIGMATMGYIPINGQILCKRQFRDLYSIVGDANKPRKIIKRYPLIRKLLRLSTYEYDTELFDTTTHFRLPICEHFTREVPNDLFLFKKEKVCNE